MGMGTGFRKRKTCKRYDIPGDAHELTFSCYKNQSFLLEKRTCIWLAEAIETARVKHDFHLWAWVFMPGHVHLLIYPTKERYSISVILQSIKQPVGRKEIARAKKTDTERLHLMTTGLASPPFRFWQEGGGHDRNLNSAKAVRATVDYVHLNPVRVGLVKNPEDWQWSSARQWMGAESDILRVDLDTFDPGP